MASRDYYRNISLRLSRVMDDIGVNEEAVMSGRRAHLFDENIHTLSNILLQVKKTCYIFGSQTEGTTTDGLNSDTDFVYVMDGFNLIKDLNDWVKDERLLLMTQEERFPGYCKLQLLKPDVPYPEDVPPCEDFTFDEAGRVILRHLSVDIEGVERHGPAEQMYDLVGSGPFDFVGAFRCKRWPNGYKLWSTHSRKGNWPAPEMISYMENSGCLVVQVAHPFNEKKHESWRISTSFAERCLMFSLNITQIRCYILIKMIVKTFIDPVVPEVISSYICKNLLFFCIENTRPDFWEESNLLRCVNQVLLNMLVAVLCMNCPNYFNESINLLLGKVNKYNQVILMGVIWKVLISEGEFLEEITFDNINELIHSYPETIYERKDCSRAKKCKGILTPMHVIGLSGTLANCMKLLILEGKLNQLDLMSLQNTMVLFALQGPLQYVSAILLFPFVCSHLATLQAHEHIIHNEMISRRTLLLYERSLDSDMMSSRLKSASYWYCTGHCEKVMLVLAEVDRRFIDGFCAVCICDERSETRVMNFYMDPSLSTLPRYLFLSYMSVCVMFSQAERRCCPRELQYEMYRSTEQEKLQRDVFGRDNWMDLACIESLPYLFFLCYMTGRHTRRRELQLRTLKLWKDYTSKKMYHSDTVYNLLGQCYEYENRFDEAFACYCKSLRVRPTNNVARWHIVLLLNRFV